MSAKLMITGLKWSALGRFTSQIISWAFTLILIRILNPEDYGLIALSQIVVSIIMYINELGMGSSIIQKENISEEEVRSVNTLLFLLNIFLFWGCYALAPFLSDFFSNENLTDVIRVLSITFVILSLSIVPRSLLVRSMNFRAVAVVKASSAFVASFFILICALNGLGVWSLVYGSILNCVGETVGYMIAGKVLPKFGMRFSALKQHLKFGSIILFQRTVWIIYTRVDIFVLGRLFDARTVGTYSVAQDLSSLPLDRIAQFVNQVTFAGFSRLQNDPALIRSYFIRGLRLAALFGFPVFLGLSAISAPLVLLVLGPKWIDSAIIMQILSLAVPLRLVSTLCSETLNAIGASMVALRNVITTAVCVTIGILAGVQWGVVGLCIGWALGFSCAFFLLSARFSKISGISATDLAWAIARPLLSCAVMYACVTYALLETSTLPLYATLILAIGTGVLSYAAACFLFCRDYWGDVVAVVRLARS